MADQSVNEKTTIVGDQIQNSTAPKNIPEDNPDSYAEISIQLTDDAPHLDGQLRDRGYRNTQPQDQHLPRDIVTEQTPARDFFFKVTCSRPRIGLYSPASELGTLAPVTAPPPKLACLVIFTFTFTHSLTSARYRRARIAITLVDHYIASLTPRELAQMQDDDRDDIRPPAILAFEPQIFTTAPITAQGSTTTQVNASAAPVSAAPLSSLSLSAGYSKTKPFVRKEAAKVECFSRGRPPSTLMIQCEENKLESSGIIPRFSIPMVVEFVEEDSQHSQSSVGRRFAATVRIQTETSSTTSASQLFSHTKYGKHDDPIWFDPTTILTEQRKRYGDQLEKEDLLNHKGVETLREWTDLKRFGGDFL